MALIETLYNKSFVLSRKARVSDGQGGFTHTWPSVSSVAGRMRPASATERTLAMQRLAEIDHVFYCDADEDVQRGDRISGSGRVWEVIAIREPSHAGHHLEIECLERQKEGQP